MPVVGRPKRGGWAASGRFAGALLLLVGGGCFFNLDVPAVPPNPPPPSLTVLAPRPGDIITLSAEVSVEADSVNGVSSVTLLCGPLDGGARQAYAWASAPYQSVVDFSICQGLTSTNPDGGLPLLQLSVQALSDAGAENQVDLQVALNGAGPQFVVGYPPSAQPLSPFTVTVTTDAGFSSLPVVTLAGVAAQSVALTSNGTDGLFVYTAFFPSTPGIGTDNYPPGEAPAIVPIEVLTDTDEVVRLSVEATAANGNTTAVDLSVDLSRVVWDRYIPGQPADVTVTDWVAEPVAFDGGLVLPLALSNATVSSTSPWIPGVLSKDDGTFYGFDVTELLPGGLDGGYLARGLNADGETLFADFTGNGTSLMLFPPPPATSPVVSSNGVGLFVTPPLTRVDDLLCLQDSATVCSDANTEGLTCFNSELTAETVRHPGLVYTGPPDSGVVAGGGGRYLSPNVAVCGTSWNLVDLTSGTVTFGPTEDPNGVARNCFIEGISRLLAVGDGTFVVQLQSSCVDGTTLEFPILRVGGGSTILGAYTAPLGTVRSTHREVVGVLSDGRVVTLRNSPPYTVFELWPMNPTTTDVAQVAVPIAGLYDSADNVQLSVVARSVYASANGSFAVLVNGAPQGVGVVAFGPGLTPLWLYLYPRVTSPGFARLVSSPGTGDIYLVDIFNNRAVSLRVESAQ